MASIAQTQQQIRERGQAIASAREKAQQFQPVQKIPQRVLRQPVSNRSGRDSAQLRQVRIKETTERRSRAKQNALNQIKQLESSQEKLEQEFRSYLSSDAGKLQYAREQGLKPREVKKGVLVGGTILRDTVALEYDTPYGKVSVPQKAFSSGSFESAIIKDAEGKLGMSLSTKERSDILASAFGGKKVDEVGKIEINSRTGEVKLPEIRRLGIKTGRGGDVTVLPMTPIPEGFKVPLPMTPVPSNFTVPKVKEVMTKIPSKELMTPIPEGSAILDEIRDVAAVRAPTGREKIRGSFGRLQKGSGIDIPEQELTKAAKITGKTVLDVSVATAAAVNPIISAPQSEARILDQLTSIKEGIISESAAGASKLVDIYGKDVTYTFNVADVPERRFMESGTTTFEPGKETEIVLPSSTFEELFPGKQFSPETSVTRKELFGITKTGAQLIGGATAAVPLYLGGLQFISAPLDIRQGVATARAPIPTKEQFLAEAKPSELSQGEWRGYLQTQEGKKFEKNADEYIQSLRKTRGGGVLQAGIGATILATPVVGRGVRILKSARDPIPIAYKLSARGQQPQVVQSLADLGKFGKGKWTRSFTGDVIQVGEESKGLITTVDYLPKIEELTVPRYRTWFGGKNIKPEYNVLQKESYRLSLEAFKDAKGVSIGQGVTQRVGPTTTLKNYFRTAGLSKEIPYSDVTKLKGIDGTLKKELLSTPLELPEGTQIQYIAGGGKIKPGVRIDTARVSPGLTISNVDLPVYLRRTSKGGKTIFIETAPSSPLYTSELSRVIPTGSKGPVSIYDVESVVKSSKSLTPKTKGGIDRATGTVKIRYVDPPSSPGGLNIISGARKSGPPQDPIQKEILATVTARASRVPKPRSKKLTPTTVSPAPTSALDSYFTTPTYVGGAVAFSSLTSTTLDSPQVAPRTQILPRSRTSILPLIRLGLEEVQISDTQIIPRVMPKVSPLTVPVIKVGQRVIPRVIPRVAPKPILRPAVRLRPPRQPPIKPPRPTPPSSPVILPTSIAPKDRRSDKTKRTPGGFIGFIRRKGKFIAVGPKVKTAKRAVKIARRAARTTLGASIQVREAKTGKAIALGKESKTFRFGKVKGAKDPFTLVQRAPRRLSARTEVAEIIAARRGVKFI